MSNANLPAVQSGPIFPSESILGESGGPLMVRRTDGNGAVVLATARIKLREGRGLVKIGSGKSAGYFPDSTATKLLNRIAALTVITPDMQAGPDGRTVPNPYLEMDDNGFVKRVTVKKVAVGKSPMGALVMTDAVVVMDGRRRLLEALTKKVERFPQAGVIGFAGAPPVTWRFQPKKWNKAEGHMEASGPEQIIKAAGELRFFAGPQGMGVWVDHTHPEILALLANAIREDDYLQRRAETVCERRALSKHPAIATHTLDAKSVKMVGEGRDAIAEIDLPVVYQDTEINREDLERLAAMVRKGEEIRELGGRPIEQQSAGAIDATLEDDDEDDAPPAGGVFNPEAEGDLKCEKCGYVGHADTFIEGDCPKCKAVAK